MDSLTISQLKSKLKRLVIEFHHHKNNTSYNHRVVHKPDLSKPLLSLRAPVTASESSRSPKAIDQDQFKEFSDLEYIEEDEEDEGGYYSHRHDSAAVKVQRGLLGTLNSYIRGRHGPGTQRQSCHCICHESNEGNEKSRGIYYHLEGCEKACHLSPDESNAGLSRDIMAQLMREGVHYIEIEEKPKKKRFLLLRSLFPGVHMPKFNHSGITKKISSMTSATSTPEAEAVTDNDGEFDEASVQANDTLGIQVQSATIDDGVAEDAENLDHIEVIALSTGTTASPERHNEESGYTEDATESTEAGAGASASASASAIPFHMRDAMKGSSYSRRQQKPTPSMISLVKVDPESAQEKKQKQGAPESWKVVMNDVSLYAALISTGAKPPQQSKSSLNLVADFTSSKHKNKHKNQFTGKAQQRFFSNETVTEEYFHKYRESEQEGQEEDLLDMATIADPKAKENMEQQIHSLLHTQSHQSILSGLLVPTESDGNGDDEAYDMLLAYDYYSDEEGETREVLPLNIRATRIF